MTAGHPSGLWRLDPEVIHLNHGSFGACPVEILDRQDAYRRELEADAVHFYMRRLDERLDAVREELGAFIGADPEGLVFVRNATEGVNAVLQSFAFDPGDEILVTDHGYAACNYAAAFMAERSGAVVKTARIPFPIRSADEAVEAILDATGPKTRLALIDHVTSPTALRLPVERIVPRLRDRGIAVLVDGAHAPGMIDLDLRALQPDWYTGNFHKWMCGPKTGGFLYAAPEHRARTRPLIISHGAGVARRNRSRFHLEFDWMGTLDVTPWLCVPDSIRFFRERDPDGGGWPAVRRASEAMIRDARAVLCETLDIPPPAPEDMVLSMAGFPLPDADEEPAPDSVHGANELRERLYEKYRIEVMLGSWPKPPKRLLRISAQLYNRPEDYRRLVEALGLLL